MSQCLSFEDLLQVGQPQLDEMQRIGDFYPSADAPGACEAFTKQVRIVEGVVVQLYGVAAALAKKADSPDEVAQIWSQMSFFCQIALGALARLKIKYPYCGTAELYDLALDYKLACDKRYRGVMEEIACQKSPLPKGVLPEVK